MDCYAKNTDNVVPIKVKIDLNHAKKITKHS